MTFINRRIIKRPTLFASSRRNFGNLLTHYETGKDGTAPEPEPEPEPEPVTFTTSWTTTGSVVVASLAGISLHRTTEVIVLTRDDGTVLATLDENKVGDWELQYDEGTNYGTYSYEIRLDGVVQSSFTRMYEPDTPTFTTNFFSPSAKTISCGVENITNPSGLFTVQLARLDGTVLDSHVLNDGTSFFLSYTEGDYGSYEYQILLNDAQVATHSQTFPRPEPTFTTSWAKSGLSITADLSSITNAHPEFYAYLTRDDGTVLSTHQFAEGQTATALSFTETDYGTFNYQLKLGTTVVSTHTETFPRPEPTFTTSWAKSGLSITADLSSIVGAHAEFYAYLTRDDGTVLATHQFAEGQTATTLSFTETDYGTFTYQLKLGTSVVSSHTETYVRPTPTYTTSFSTSELTLTASITSITNAHSSFAITLERDDGTVLQTHTLVDGETSFTFTQTETSYATYNYVVKLNGTQTDTYSATYTPPPTPTFDIALTNDDLAITATLTNIVNPDPYYTVSIHDANAQLASHIFQITDTSVSLTWNETTYGDKSYTVKINGTASSTETITLTDPNGSTPTFIPVQLDETGDTNLGRNYKHVSTSGTVYTFQLYNGDVADSAGVETYITYDTSDRKWRDAGTDHPNTFAVSSSSTYTTSGHSDPSVATGTDNAEYIHLVRNNGYQHLLTFKMAGWSSTSSSTPTQPTLVNTISITGGAWDTATYYYVNTDVDNTYYEYGLSIAGEHVKENYYIAYNWTTRKWFDTQPTTHHNTFGTSSTDLNTTSRETTENPAVVYVFDTSPRFVAEFTNPYYEPQQMSWGGATVIALSGGAWDSASTAWEYRIDVNQTTSSSVFFEAYDGTNLTTDRGIEFRNVSGQTYLFCGTDDNNFQPVSLSTTTHSSQSDNHPIYLNDTVTLWSKHTPPLDLGSFTVTSELLYSVYPQTLPSLDSSSLFSQYVYAWRFSTATHEVYDVKYNDGSDNDGLWWSDTVADTDKQKHTIAVNRATNTWEDYGSSHPFAEPVENADGTILITDGPNGTYPNLYKFTKPTTASWIAPYRTGTSQNVDFSGGTWSSLSYSLLVDDTPSSASSGITLPNGDKAWDFDLVIPGYGNVNTGENQFIRFIAGPTVGTGIWSKGTDYDAVRDTTDTNKINFINANGGLDGVLYETDAFVDGLVPYGDIP